MAMPDQIAVLAKNSKGDVVLQKMRWGLIPASFTGFPESWDANTTHARIETVAELQSFKNAWSKKKRVIVPMEHIYQKAPVSAISGGRSSQKIRVAISRADKKPLGVAGIYDYAQTATGPVLSFAMLTREPGSRMVEIHDREPVVIEPERFQDWLDGADDLALERPWADDAFEVVVASK